MGAAMVTVKLEPWQFDVIREALAFELDHCQEVMKNKHEDEDIRHQAGARALSIEGILRLIR
jgi:hypothetical protein